ncbi:MAG: hypothetical protein QOK44_1979 [Betaproteobacteria bacterium]|nr:hypothetical protein [Betaproteobacteria bacterium]
MANAAADALPLSPDGIVVVGEKLSLFVEAEQFFSPQVTVTFRAFFTDSSGADKELTFTESLVAANAPPRSSTSTLKASRIAWVANLDKGKRKDAEARDCVVIFTVSGTNADGRRVIAKSSDKIIIRPILITKDPKLTRIMVHEFSRIKTPVDVNDIDPFQFDEAPLQAYIDALSVQQKKMLLNRKVSTPGGRLVVFLTVYRQKRLRMCADFGPGNGSAHPNATFSVFHCQGPGKDVTLVCHTEHFLLNLFNGPTNQWLHAPQKGKAAKDWLKKSNTAPPLFKIGSMLPQTFCDGVLWSRIFTASGQDIMRGNTMHGMINTIGCWMLFRNFNWPVEKAVQFDRLYRKTYRPGFRFGALEAALKLPENGYDAPDDPTDVRSGSFNKFMAFDKNIAYLWFFHEVVGVKYFSELWRFGHERFVHDFRTHGKIFNNDFLLSRRDNAPRFNLPDEGTFAFHDHIQRQEADAEAAKKLDPVARRNAKRFVPDNTLWRNNALGFKTAEGFLPVANGIFGNLAPAQVDRFTWADLHVYAEDDVDITRVTSNYKEAAD